MQAKCYLSQLRYLKIAISQKQNELEELRIASTSIRSFDYSKEKVQTSLPDGAPHEHAVQRIADLDYEINRQIKQYIAKKHKMIDQIQGLENALYAEILYKRYVEEKSLENIAAEMRYSYGRIRHLHGEALLAFDKKYLRQGKVSTQ